MDRHLDCTVVRLGKEDLHFQSPHFLATWLTCAKQGLDNGFLGYDIKGKTATIWDGGDRKFTLTNVDQMQCATVAVLERADETINKNIYVASAETSQWEILTALEEASGAKYTVTDTATDTEVSAAMEKLGHGDVSGACALVRATSFGNTPQLRANYVKDEELSNELLGLKFEPVKETAARVVAGAK